jgi:hypothetical protein
MADEYIEEVIETEDQTIPRYSGFWPLLILLTALLLWSGFQAFQAFRQTMILNNDFQAALPTIKAAQDAKAKLYSIAQDLIQTSAKDQNAAQLVREAGIQIKPNPSSASSAGGALETPPADVPK